MQLSHTTRRISAAAGAVVLSAALAQAQPTATVELLDEVVAVQATVHQLRTGPDGPELDWEMGLFQTLHTVESLPPEQIVDFMNEYRKAVTAPAANASGGASVGLAIGSFKPLGLPVSVGVTVDQEVSSLIRDLWPRFVGSRIEPAAGAVAQTPLTAAGVLEVEALRDSYQAWSDRRTNASLTHELLAQEATARHHVRQYKSDAGYRTAWDELFGARFPFRPTDPATAIMPAMPAFADFKNGEAVLDEVRELRAAIEAGEAGDGQLEALLQEVRESGSATLDLIRQDILDRRRSKLADEKTAYEEAAKEELRKIRDTDRQNLRTVLATAAGALYFIAPKEVQEQVDQILVVADAGADVLKAIRRFDATPTGANQNLAAAALSGNIAMAAVSLFSSFMGGPSPEQQILEEIAKLKEMIQELREEMNERFDQLYDTMTDGFEQLAEQHAITHTMLYRIELRLWEQLDELLKISDQVRDLRSDLFKAKLMVIDKLNQLGLHGCLRDPAFPRPVLSEEEYRDCLEGFKNALADLPALPLSESQVNLMGEHLADAENLALQELRRLMNDRSLGRLPRNVVGVRRLLGTLQVLRDFLVVQAEHTEAHADAIRSSQLMSLAVQYGDALNRYIEAVVEELTALQGADESAPSAFDALLGEVDAELESLRNVIENAAQDVYTGIEGLPLDRMTSGAAVPPWVTQLGGGHCTDYAVPSAVKSPFLVDTPNRLQALVHRDDLRPARAGWGRIAVCARSYFVPPKRLLNRTTEYSLRVSLTIDFRPDPALGCGDDPIRLFRGRWTGREGRRWPQPGDETWIRLFRKGMQALTDKPNPKPVLPAGCRYRDHPERFDEATRRFVVDQVLARSKTAIDDATAKLELAEATLLSWLTTAFGDDAFMLGDAGDLSLPNLREELNSTAPWRLVDPAKARLEAVAEALRSDEMRDVVRLDAGHILESR